MMTNNTYSIAAIRARFLWGAIGHWLSVDPLADKYPNISPYAYAAWNPVGFVDPNGMWIEVSPNEDGTYQVVNGDLNKDKSIYIVENGERTGEVLGKMYSMYSFFGEDGKVVNSVINPNDQSGIDFLSQVESNPPTLANYIQPVGDYTCNESGWNYGRYDFKSNGKTIEEYKGMKTDKIDEYYNRGLPMNRTNNVTYGTARDIGNFAAGYIAGRKGLGIVPTLIGFDALQSYKSGSLCTEPPVSRNPQLRGYFRGIVDYFKNSLY